MRIVKRESTERRKDRSYCTSKKGGDLSLSHVLEDDLESDSGEPTSDPELDSESSPAHVPLSSSLSASAALKSHNHLSSSYSSGYSSSSQTFLQPHPPKSQADQDTGSGYSGNSASLYHHQTSSSDYPSSSLPSVPHTTSNSSGQTVLGSNPPGGMPSYSARTASLPRNYGRGNEWGDKPNRRVGKTSNHSSNSASNSASSSATTSRPSNLPLKQKQTWKSKVTEIVCI